MRRKAGLVKGGTRPPLTFIPIAPVTSKRVTGNGKRRAKRHAPGMARAELAGMPFLRLCDRFPLPASPSDLKATAQSL